MAKSDESSSDVTAIVVDMTVEKYRHCMKVQPSANR